MRQTERIVMSMVPDITAGTGTESDETPFSGGSGGLSQSEGAQARVLSVDRCLFRVPGHRSWPTLDLHYGVRQEEHCRKPRPNRTLATFRYRRLPATLLPRLDRYISIVDIL